MCRVWFTGRTVRVTDHWLMGNAGSARIAGSTERQRKHCPSIPTCARCTSYQRHVQLIRSL